MQIRDQRATDWLTSAPYVRYGSSKTWDLGVDHSAGGAIQGKLFRQHREDHLGRRIHRGRVVPRVFADG